MSARIVSSLDFRLKIAAGLLQHSSFGIPEVAARSGFNDVSNFYESFKRKFSTTPLRFRRQAQTDT